jgi:hypothetical protein
MLQPTAILQLTTLLLWPAKNSGKLQLLECTQSDGVWLTYEEAFKETH